MLDLNKYGIIGAQSLFTGKKTAVLDPAPTITTQPNSIVLFQVGGKMSFTGAAVAGASSVGWQKRNDDGSWSNTNFSSVTPSKGTATSADAGVYRLRAINGNSQPVYSNLVYAYDCFLFIQNDNESNNPATTGVLAGADRYHWKEDGPVGTRLYSAFLRFNKAQTLPSGATVAENVALDNNAVTELGLKSGRTVATWSSSNSAVAAISNGYAPGQTAVRLNAGAAVVTAKYQNLTADIAVTIA